MNDKSAGKTGAAESKTRSQQKKPLPRSGLAKEILQLEGEAGDQSVQDSAADAEQPISSSPTRSPSPEGSPAEGPDLPQTPPPTGPERLFEFADSLEQDDRDEETQARPAARIETWVTFSLAGETFALPVSHVQEILRVSSITTVPHAPAEIRGVINKRGRVLSVVDLRRRLALPEAEVDRQSRILVVETRKRLLGLLVDEVQQVVRLDRNQVQPPPLDVMTAQSDYLVGVYDHDEKLVILLDVFRVLIIKDAA